jgi:protocatechuate 3,4-dioxygenase beta subunit
MLCIQFLPWQLINQEKFMSQQDNHDSHDRGLHYDLELIARRINRRQVISLGSSMAAFSLLPGCGGSSASTAGTTNTTAAQSSVQTQPSANSTCVADPTATTGPYPADGTNTASGATSNVLQTSGIIRSNIRPSFIGTPNVAPGIPVELTLTLVNTNAACARLSNYAVYLWQADRDGFYSLYTRPVESWLRGIQISNANGQVTFLTNFPPAYDGRYPHMHFEIFTSIQAALTGRSALFTSQLAMPRDIASTVFQASGYQVAQSQLASVTTSSDFVFRSFSASQLANATPLFTGDVVNGYKASATIGIAA